MTRAFIYGSCVTRDGVDVDWRARGLDLVGYVARQSLLSVGAPVDVSQFDLKHIPSHFQRRMALGDLRGDLVQRISSSMPLDLIIWDLTDERSGVREVVGGGVVSGVIPYRHSGVRKGSSTLRRSLAMGSVEHLSRWALAARQFAEQLGDLGVLNRLFVIQRGLVRLA